MMIIAHRGASGYSPENTIEAFEKALSMGSKAFEFDVHRTLDGVLVVSHDYDFNRTAGINLRIKDLKYDEIKKINVAKFFGNNKFSAPPSISEVLLLLKDKADFINIEVKNDENIYPEIEDDVIKIVKEFKIEEKVIISSFYFPSLKKFREKSKSLRLAFLSHKLDNTLFFSAIKKAKSLNCENFHLNKKIAYNLNVNLLKDYGFKVFVYTVNKYEEAKRLENLGVDGIFSNYPDIMEKG